MKIKPEHYVHLKTEMRRNADKIPAHRVALSNDARVKDVEKRLRWDLLYSANLSPWICDNLYSYMDDTHIDTALRQIVKEIEKHP